MATMSQPLPARQQRVTENVKESFPADSLRFDTIYAVELCIFVVGLFLDGWAHNHGKVDNTFFTPWHAILYGSVLLIAVTLAGTHVLNTRKGYSVWRALPEGYTLSLIGVILFFIGGGFDFVWHSLFGFEANLETLLSPAHMLLATSGVLFVTGPLRAVWHRRGGQGWRLLFPAIVSLTVIFSLFTFFTQYANFWANPTFITGTTAPQEYNTSYLMGVSGVVSVLIATALMMGVLLLAMRRWPLPFGTLTFMMTANFALMYWMRNRGDSFEPLLMGAGILAGVLGDGLLAWLKPSAERPIAVRAFAFLFPVFLALLYYAAVIGTAGTWWKVHLWLGTAFSAGVVGLFLSYLAIPPAIAIRDVAGADA